MKFFLAFLLFVFALTGCTTAPIAVKRESDLQIQLKGIRVVFADHQFAPSQNALFNDLEINRLRLKLGDAVIEKVPEKLKEYNLPSIGKLIPADKVRTTKDISAYFPGSPDDWHVLVVQPFNVVKFCLSCSYVFAVNLTLIDPITQKIVWKSLLDQPTVNFTSWGPRGALNNFSYKMAEALIAGLQRDPNANQIDKVTK